MTLKRSHIKIGELYQPTNASKLHIWNTEPTWFTEEISEDSEIIDVVHDDDCFIILELLPATGNKKYLDIKILSHKGIIGWVSTDLCYIKKA